MTKYAQESADVTLRLSADEVAIILSFLPPTDILRARVCTTWRDAAKQTLVPVSEFKIDSVKNYNAMRVMSTALSNIQQLTIYDIVDGANKYIDGEDPDEHISRKTSHYSAHDINIISNFSKLRIMEIHSNSLNGRYPALFNFPLLQKLSIVRSCCLDYDLDTVIAGFPLLKDLTLESQHYLTGNLNSLRALKNTLESVVVRYVEDMKGNFMDLADFPHLKELNLLSTAVTGDIRDIRGHDFPAIESLNLPKAAIGGSGYEFQRISDVPTFMQTIHPLLKRLPNLLGHWGWCLSCDSPDHYDHSPPLLPPFRIRLVHSGSRLGWCWCSPPHYFKVNGSIGRSCEINWLDPEPGRDSNEYQAYIEEMQRIEHEHINPEFFDFRGYTEPPTEEEYQSLHRDYLVRKSRSIRFDPS